MNEYSPEVIAVEARRYPAIEAISLVLGSDTTVTPVPIPLNCTDGFLEAYYGRPERFLDPAARLACSAWSFVEPTAADRAIGQLERDLASGDWDARYGHLRSQAELQGSLRLVVA